MKALRYYAYRVTVGINELMPPKGAMVIAPGLDEAVSVAKELARETKSERVFDVRFVDGDYLVWQK